MQDYNKDNFNRKVDPRDPNNKRNMVTSSGSTPYSQSAGDKNAELRTKPEGLAYFMFVDRGFEGNFEDFMSALSSDEEVKKYAFEMFVEEGFEGTLDQFEETIGLKKKAVPELSGLKSHQEMVSEYKLAPGLLEREDYDDEDGVNPIVSALTFLAETTESVPLVGAVSETIKTGSESGIIQSQLSQQIFPLLTNKDSYSDESIDRLIDLNKRLQNAPKSESRKRFDKGYYDALDESAKKIADNPYGDLDEMTERFKQGEFKTHEKDAYNEYTRTGEINTDLLPKRELTFLDDLGAFFQAASLPDTAQAMAEVGVSSLVSMFTNPAAISVGAVTGAGGAAVGSTVPVIGTGVGAASGFFSGASAVLDATLRFNDYLNETLQEQGLKPTKENYKKILEDDDLISELQFKALKGGLAVGTIDGITTMLGASVAAKTSRNVYKTASKFKRGTQALKGGGLGTMIDASGGALGEASAQKVTGEDYDGKAIIEEFFAEVPSAFATQSWAAGSAAISEYKINGERVSEETFDNALSKTEDADLEKMNFSTNDSNKSEQISKRLKRQGVKNNLDPSIPESKVERIVDKELEIQKLDGKNSTSAKMKVSQLKQEVKDIIEEPEQTVEDIQISDLEQTLRDQGVQFQLSTEATPEERKAELLEAARSTMDQADMPSVSEDVYQANEAEVEMTPVDYSSQPLADDSPKVSANTLVGKKVNLVMADQLMVGDVKTESGKTLKRMGGVIFPLIPELKGKIAWASIDKAAARSIVRGSIKSDATAVFNMKPSAIDSNVALVEYAFEQIQGKAKDQKEVFKQFKEYLTSLKISDKASEFLSGLETFKDMVDNFDQLNVTDRAAIAKNALPTESVTTKIPYLKQLVDLGITVESARKANIEPALEGVPMGSLLSTLEITDKDGNKITSEEDIDKAIVTREQAEAEGLPLHDNYSVYIRGRHVALFNETAPFWNYVPEALNKIDLKISGAIKQSTKDSEGNVVKQRTLTSREARSAEQRAATMSASKATEFVGPDVTQYDKFVSMISKSIPGINIVTDAKEFEKFRDDIYARKMITKGQKVYGAVRGNTMYINPDLQNFNTPVHELGHLWINTVKSYQENTYNKGIDLVKNTEYHNRILESKEYNKVVNEMKKAGFSQADIDSYILEEALATAIGDKGEAFVKASTMQRFKQWLQNLYDFIRTQLGISQYTAQEIENLSFDEFTNSVAIDILRGEPLFEQSQVQTIDELQLQTSDSDIYEIIRVARSNGFPEAVIQKFLQDKGFTKKEIANASKINVDALNELPKSFYHATDTATDGLSLFTKIFDYTKKRVKKFGNDKAINLAIENGLKKDPIFKRSDDIVREDMIRDFTRFMGKKLKSTPNPDNLFFGVGRAVVTAKEKVETMSQEMKQYKLMLRDLDRGAKNLQQLQRQVRNFIRKSIPRTEYKKSEVNKLIKLVTDTRTDVDVIKAIRDTESYIMTLHNKELQKKVDKLINYDPTSKQSGRLKGKISIDAQERLAKIKQYVAMDESELSGLLRNADNEKDINDILIAGDYVNAVSQDESSFGRMQSMAEVKEDLTNLINNGRDERAMKAAELRRKQTDYKNMTLSELTGEKTTLEDVDNIKVSAQQKKKNQNKFDRTLERLSRSITATRGYLLSDITDIFDVISKSTGSIIGGKLEETFTMRLKDSENTYKSGKLYVYESLVNSKLEQIYGRDWEAETRLHMEKKYTGIILNNGEELELSQSQAYYLYNMAKDPANDKSFEKKFGENYREILDKVEAYLKPEVKRWADYQTDILFPLLYDRYNETYREMYDTNLPWNASYAGRIYREGVDVQEIDMLNDNIGYRNSVAGSSTKARINSTAPIKTMDGDLALASYLSDMEQFRAYATTIRDVDAVFKSPEVRSVIEITSGSKVNSIIDSLIKTIANRGADRTQIAGYLNTGIDLFISSRLGLNPVIAIKQLTSIPAYSSSIGPANWFNYSSKALPNVNTLWKEITDNSTYIKDRYNKSISDALSASKKGTSETIVQDKYKKGLDKYVEMMLILIQYGDKAGIMGGIPNYLYYKDKFKKSNPNATEQQAIDYAIKKFEYDTSKTQQSYDLTDRDLLQSQSYARVLNMFITTPKQYLRKEISALRQLSRAARGKKYKRSVTENLYTFGLYHVMMPMLFQFVTLGGPFKLFMGGLKDDDYEDLIRAAILGNVNGFIAVGELIENIADTVQGKPWAGTFRNALPIYEALTPVFKAFKSYNNASESKKTEKAIRLVGEITSVFGVPQLIHKYADLAYDFSHGNIKNENEVWLRLLGFSEYTAKKIVK